MGLRSDSVERRLAERQIHVKDGKSKSWFVYVNKVLQQYGLPSKVDLLDAGYTKAQWKSLYEQAVNGYWSDKNFGRGCGKNFNEIYVQNYWLIWSGVMLVMISCRSRGLVGRPG